VQSWGSLAKIHRVRRIFSYRSSIDRSELAGRGKRRTALARARPGARRRLLGGKRRCQRARRARLRKSKPTTSQRTAGGDSASWTYGTPTKSWTGK